jgi:hypothetical protein
VQFLATYEHHGKTVAFKRKGLEMKLIWTELRPASIEFRYYWTKENGWVEKQIPKQPIYILKESV